MGGGRGQFGEGAEGRSLSARRGDAMPYLTSTQSSFDVIPPARHWTR